jgi:outer membrane immunogenic protein
MSTAFAADLPTIKGPAPFMPPPPVFSWTGFYVGLNAGISAGNFNQTYYEPYDDGYYTAEGAHSGGFSGGGQIGFNYQFANNVVIGLEADFQGSTLKGSYENDAYGYDYGEYYNYNYGTKVDWWGTVRGRIGYAFGNILPYVTGGLAYGHVTNSYSYYDDGDSYSGTEGSSTRFGWTVGGGLEYALTHNLTVKVEYLYTDLGSFNYYYPDSEGAYLSTRTTFSTVRAGLNWKFDFAAPPIPVVAKY